MKKAKFKFQEKSDNFHFFASSIAEWRVDTNLDDLLRFMKKDSFPFIVYRVELPSNAEYGIRNYTPDIDPEKLIEVGFWSFD